MRYNAEPRGAFIVVEGPDGVGKTTAVQGLAERIRTEYGRHVLTLREPGGTSLGEQVRSILHAAGGEDGIVDLFLFSAARRQLIRECVRPALDAGTIVLCDRFFLSTYAYQGGGLGVEDSLIETVTNIALGDLRPDITLLLELGDDEWEGRINQRSRARDRYEQPAFLAMVRDRYAELAQRFEGIGVVSAAGTPAQVVDRLLAATKPFLREPVLRRKATR